MRFHTGISATRKSRSVVSIIRFPNPATEPEIKIEFGGLGVWLSVEEATWLSADLLAASTAVSLREGTGRA